MGYVSLAHVAPIRYFEQSDFTRFQDALDLEGGGAGGRSQNAELGGVVMRHDEMVAADREQELPPGSQESIAEVDMMVSLWAEG